MFLSHLSLLHWESAVLICSPLVSWLICGTFLISSFLSCFYILDISPLSEVELVKMFSQSICLKEGVFCLTWGFQLHDSPFIVSFIACSDSVLFRKSFPVQMSPKLFLTFSSIEFGIFCFMLISLINLELSFVHAGLNGSIWILLHAAIHFDQHICWRCWLFFLAWIS